MELIASAQSFFRNESLVATSKSLLKNRNLNFLPGVLFNIKT